MTVRKLALGLLVCAAAQAQTRVDLRSQTKNVDFSEAVSTRPFRMSSTLPGACATGEMLFHTGAPAGSNVYGCIAKDTWTVMSPDGDAAGFSAGPGIAFAGSEIRVDTSVVPLYFAGEGTPWLPCKPGRDYYVDTTGGKLYFCSASNVWSAAGRDGALDAGSITTGIVAAARLGSGIADSSTVLHGDNVYRPLPSAPPAVAAARTIEYPGAKCFSGAAATPLSLPVSGAPIAACMNAGNGSAGVLQFPDDGLTVISAEDRFLLTGSSVSLDIWWRADVANSSLSAVWQMQTACVGADEDVPAWGTPQVVVSSAHGTANRWRKASLTGLTPAGCTAGRFLLWKISRDPGHTSDTLGATAELISLVWTVQ